MIEEMIKIIGAIVSVYLLMKTTIEIQSLKINHKQSDYDFTKRILEDLKTCKSELGSLSIDEKHLRLFLVEKGIRSLTGRNIGLNEFEYLLSHNNPSISIIRRNSASSFIRWRDDLQGYCWMGIYQKAWARRFGPKILQLSYFATALPGILAFLVFGGGMFKNVQLTFVCGSLLALGVLSVVKSENLKSAKNFMDEYSPPVNSSDSSNNELNGDAAGGAR